MITYKTAPLLMPTVQQRSHHDLLTATQVDEAKAMGIKGMTTSNTQYDLLKLVRFQVTRNRHTGLFEKNLTHKHGRKVAKKILNKLFDNQTIIK
jgi:hypothetical protein